MQFFIDRKMDFICAESAVDFDGSEFISKLPINVSRNKTS